jgi:SAM-dependent methyltransferase
MTQAYERMYADRLITEGWPDLETKGFEHRQASAPERVDQVDTVAVERVLRRLGRLVDVSRPRRIVVVGCGHRPALVKRLLELGHEAVGIEPVQSYVAAAGEYLGREDVVRRGVSEEIPLESGSQDLVMLEDVLEHVDSISKALGEVYRVTAPGGIAYVKTNSRWRFSPTGFNAEFRVPFYNWLPAMVKECYVHHQLHFDPSLAAFTSRPAVHWFDFARLCAAGREAGFCRFYSLLDVVEPSDPEIAGNRLRRALVRAGKYHPWLRALALTQLGGYIYMLKRPRSLG